jgi:lipid II:glycine glycyltransferase (peptidoglycan interpeptide bridge formation enzyme)
MTEIKTIHDQTDWEQALTALPAAHALQSWEWGEFKARWGWSVVRLVWTQSTTPVAAAQILGRVIPGTPWRFLYVAKGPALDYGQPALADRVLADLERYARETKALFIKIDPDVPRQYGEPDEAQTPDMVGQAILNLLNRRGWRFSPEQIQFRNTVIIDLTPNPDDLLAAMNYNVRLAGRKGVTVRAGAPADLAAFYPIYAETAARDGFLIRPEAYYHDVWQRFLETGQADLLLAWAGDEPVAGLILFYNGRTAWYMVGASAGEHRHLMPNHLLQWAAIERAKARGCTRYDMWGAPEVFDESDRMWGVYRFKQGFGGQVVQGLGAFDYPVNRPLYWAFTAALPRLRALLRHGRQRG